MKKTWLVLALVLAVATGAYGVTVATAGTAANPKVHGHVGKGHGTVHGTVTNVDTTNNQVTLTTLHKCASVTFSVTTNTRVRVDNKKSALTDILGMSAVAKLARDGSAKSIHAWNTPALHGTVGSVDTSTNQITVMLKKTCASVGPLQLTSNTKVRVNLKKAALANVQTGFRVVVKLNRDGTVRWIKAHTPTA